MVDELVRTVAGGWVILVDDLVSGSWLALPNLLRTLLLKHQRLVDWGDIELIQDVGSKLVVGVPERPLVFGCSEHSSLMFYCRLTEIQYSQVVH